MAKPPTPGERSLNNMLIGAAVTTTILLGIPGLFAALGLPGAPSSNGWWVLAAACFALLVKLIASETATGEFEFYKFGYDSCITTLGATISAGAIQLYSTVDVFPGMAKISYLPTFGLTDQVKIRTAQLMVFFALAWLVTLFAARVCGGIKKKDIDERGGKAFACAAVGPLLLCIYAIMLASKG